MSKEQRDLLMKAIIQYGIWTYRLGQSDPNDGRSYENSMRMRSKYFEQISDYLDSAVDLDDE
tara:strand:+ start:1751 stop:1936 length:186 start_codon:yes stop_codon:yes gene_type:complete